ncbi:hypothetical protein FGB62_88g026 [Gracilaria domingensis]|nr:hypothetical protein FGB62_88g026 [Gracilaria domingensis]
MTETVYNSLDVQWATSFEIPYFFERAQKLAVDVFDRDDASEKDADLFKHDYLGSANVSVPALQAAHCIQPAAVVVCAVLLAQPRPRAVPHRVAARRGRRRRQLARQREDHCVALAAAGHRRRAAQLQVCAAVAQLREVLPPRRGAGAAVPAVVRPRRPPPRRGVRHRIAQAVCAERRPHAAQHGAVGLLSVAVAIARAAPGQPHHVGGPQVSGLHHRRLRHVAGGGHRLYGQQRRPVAARHAALFRLDGAERVRAGHSCRGRHSGRVQLGPALSRVRLWRQAAAGLSPAVPQVLAHGQPGPDVPHRGRRAQHVPPDVVQRATVRADALFGGDSRRRGARQRGGDAEPAVVLHAADCDRRRDQRHAEHAARDCAGQHAAHVDCDHRRGRRGLYRHARAGRRREGAGARHCAVCGV